jgi:hypothetical protein
MIHKHNKDFEEDALFELDENPTDFQIFIGTTVHIVVIIAIGIAITLN